MEENNQGRDYYEDEIDLYELMGVLWKKKGLIVFIVAISVICAGVYVYSGSRAITEEMVKLSFSGIDKHLYPDGSAFDMHDLIAPDILEKASKGIEDPEHRQAFMENPRSYCFVKPFIPLEITAEIERMEKEKKTFIYLPTQFHLQFIETKDRPFGTQEKDRLLLGIKTAYVDKFKKNFINPKILALALSKDAFSRLDYIDQIDCLDKQVQVYVSFLDDRIEDAGHYRSIDTGDSFVDILNSLNNLMDNDLNETKSVIDTLRLTKDRQILEKKYVHQIKMIEKNRQKKQNEAQIALDLLDNVWKNDRNKTSQSQKDNMQSLVMDLDVLDKLSQKEYISMLIERALGAGVQASSLKVDKEFVKKDLATLKKQDMDTTAKDRNLAEKKLESIRSRVIELGTRANALNREYMEKKYPHIIQVLKQPYSFISYDKDPGMVILLSLVASLFLAVFIAFFMEYISNAKKDHTRKGDG